MRKHPLWEGSLSFGLVNIPVILELAENRSEELSFSLLDRRDFSPVGYRKINKVSGEEVPKEELVKGYEYEKGEYVILTPDDFRRASPEKTQRIDIVSFVEAGAIDVIYFDRPYYLEPVEKNEKSYVLFREALARTRKVAVASFVLHNRQHLGAIFVRGPLLLLEMLRYHYELIDESKLPAPPKTFGKRILTDKELNMAEQLIESMAGEWNPKEFRDEYQSELKAFIQKKARQGKTETVAEAPAVEAEPQDRDIMTLLKRSLQHKTPQHALRR